MLTSKQEKFVQELIKGSTKADAYRNAGYKTDSMTENTVYKEAQHVFNNPKVSRRYNELIEQIGNKAIWTREKATETLVNVIDECKRALTREFESEEGKSERIVDSKMAAQIISAVSKLNDMNGFNEHTVNQKTDGQISVDITVTDKVSK